MHTNPEVLALLALGEDSATEEEREHIAGCSVCAAEVAELAHLAGVGRAVNGSGELQRPDPEVWERIRVELGFTAESTRVESPPASVATVTELDSHVRRTAPPAQATTGSTTTGSTATGSTAGAPTTPLAAARRSPARRWLLAGIAAALALVVGFGAGLGWTRLRDPAPTVVAEARLTALPSWSGSSGQATLERRPNGDRELVISLNAAEPLAGFQQVWLINSADPSKMVPVGFLRDGREGHWGVADKIDIKQYNIVDVSEEPTDFLDQRHSGNSIVRGALDV